MIVTEKKVATRISKGQNVSLKAFGGDVYMTVVDINPKEAKLESEMKVAILKWKNDGWYQDFLLFPKK